jgi:hypothetical protein
VVRSVLGSAFALFFLCAACGSGDEKGAGAASSAGQTGNRPDGSAGLGGSGGTDEREPTESALRGCTGFCRLLSVLDQASPCNTGDLVVRGRLVPHAEGGAGGAPDAPDEPTETALDPGCMDQCLSAQERGGEKCEPTFQAMADCFAETIWLCSNPGSSWVAQDCDIQATEASACVEQ